MDDRMVCSILVSAPGPLGFELIWGLGTKSLGPGLDNKGTPIDKDNLVRYSCNWELRVWGQGLTTRTNKHTSMSRAHVVRNTFPD